MTTQNRHCTEFRVTLAVSGFRLLHNASLQPITYAHRVCMHTLHIAMLSLPFLASLCCSGFSGGRGVVGSACCAAYLLTESFQHTPVTTTALCCKGTGRGAGSTTGGAQRVQARRCRAGGVGLLGACAEWMGSGLGVVLQGQSKRGR